MRIAPWLLVPIAAALATPALAVWRPSADGFEFSRKQFERLEPQISVVTYEYDNDLQAAARRLGARGTKNMRAFVVMQGERCEIHVIDPERSWQPQDLGHEFAHCVWGDWHSARAGRR